MRRIPEFSFEHFVDRLRRAPSSPAIGDEVAQRLFAHFEELRRWSPRIDLIGPGAADELIERHYAESLAATTWIPTGARLLDLGSGAGFPGLVLAAARLDLEVWLLEPRERRAAFLAAAARRAKLSVRVVNARVSAHHESDLPDAIDRLTVRALRLDARSYRALLPHLSAGARLLSWSGEQRPDLPREFVRSRERRLEGSERRYLREYLLRDAGR